MSLTREQASNLANGETTPATEASTPSRLSKQEAQSAADSASYLYGWGDARGLNPEEFDFDLKAGNFDNMLYRAQSQGWGEQLTNATIRGLAKIPFEVVGSAASILDFEDYVNQDNEIGNDIVRGMNSIKESLDEAMPIYRERPGGVLDVSDFAWWAENGSGLLTSAAAFAITGFGTGALLSKGTTALKWAASLTKSGKIVTGAEKVGRGLSILGTSAGLNQAEGILSAIDIYDTTFKDALSQGLSNDEAKDLAAHSAAHSIKVNRINIMLNLTSSNAFFGGFNRGMTRAILKKQSLMAKMGFEGAQEYAEEVVNLYAEKEGRRQAELALRGNTDIADEAGQRFIDTMFSLEGLEAGLLGAVGGIAQTGFTHIGRNITVDGKSKNAELNKRIAEQQKFISELDAEAKKKGLPNFYTATTQGREIGERVEKRNTLFGEAKKFTDAGEEVPTDLLNEIEFVNSEILQAQSVANFVQGTTEHLENHYKEIAGLTIDEAKERGFKDEQLNEKSPAYYKDRATKALKQIA